MKVSLVVPMHNEAAIVDDFFTALTTQVHLPEEVIVVDNNSTDRTVEQVRAWSERLHELGSQLVLLFCTNGNQAEARHVGSKTAKHPLIVFVDADSILPDNWVADAMQLFETRPEMVGAGGPMIYDHISLTALHACAFVFYRLFPSTFGFYGSNAVFRKEAYHASGGLSGYREVFRSGRYPEAFDDVYLAAQLKQVGSVLPFFQLRAHGLYRIDGKRVSVVRMLWRTAKQSIHTLRFHRAVREQAQRVEGR